MTSSMKNLLLPWCAGGVLFFLHLAENLTGYDSETGLALPSVARHLLVGAAILAALLIWSSARKTPGTRPLFSEAFAPVDGAKLPLIIGSFLLMAGGVLLGTATLSSHGGVAPLITAALAVLAGFGLLVLTRKLAAGEHCGVMPLLPAMFFAAFWVLTTYLPAANDPVLSRYALPILAAAATAGSVSLLAGFFRGETKVRTFHAVSGIAVALSITAAADLSAAPVLLHLGSAIILSVFLSLRQS